MRERALRWRLVSNSSSLRAARGWQGEDAQQGVGLWKVSAALPLKCLTSGTLSFHSSVKNEAMLHHLLLDRLLDVHE